MIGILAILGLLLSISIVPATVLSDDGTAHGDDVQVVLELQDEADDDRDWISTDPLASPLEPPLEADSDGNILQIIVHDNDAGIMVAPNNDTIEVTVETTAGGADLTVEIDEDAAVAGLFAAEITVTTGATETTDPCDPDLIDCNIR
ncbi:MAG: hypothetical protein ACE5IG_05275, partial [Dehalococcoidia bacterium]